jgi:hypothetical protein
MDSLENTPTTATIVGGAVDGTQSGFENSTDTTLSLSGQQDENSVLTTLYTLLTASIEDLIYANAATGGLTMVSVQYFSEGASLSGTVDDIDEGDESSIEPEESANARIEEGAIKNATDAEAASTKQFGGFNSKPETIRSNGTASSAQRTGSQPGHEAGSSRRSVSGIGTANNAAVGNSTITADREVSERNNVRNAVVGRGGTVDQVQDAAILNILDDRLFDWSRALLALAVLGMSGGVLVVRRR